MFPQPSPERVFPCQELPELAGHQKLLGLYSQGQQGLWLQRICIPGGRLTAAQWRTLADVAERCTPGTPLHLTTRQDIEIHDLRASQIGEVHAMLHAAGLSCFGAAGDTIRNITVCPCAGTAAGSPDLMPMARYLMTLLRQKDGIYDLPRKFKITLACSPDCGQPWINDLAFIADRSDGADGFRVIGAGSLGARPRTGIELFSFIPADKAPALVEAAVSFFAEHGDRQNRSKARFRHVRERMGDDAFRRELASRFERLSRDRNDSPPTGDVGVFHASVTLNFAKGDVTAEAARGLARLAERDETAVRIANQHQVIIYGATQASVASALAEQSALEDAMAMNVSVVACPGTRWCKRGLVDTNAMAEVFRSSLVPLPAGRTICISGCPNGCSHPAVADIGLVGKRHKEGEQAVECFDLLWGGEMGRGPEPAHLLAPKMRPEEIVPLCNKKLRGDP
jgi:sulfite reductase (ferredoxin)